MSIVVCGATFVDIKGYPLDQYIPNGGRNSGRIEQVHGGVCRNVAEDIANVGLNPIFLSLVDPTGLGDDVVRRLREHKVNVDYLPAVPDGMGTWLAVFNNDGDVTAAISKRPNLLPICDVMDKKGDEIFAQADSIAFEIDIEREIQDRLFFYADKYNIPVFAGISNMSIALERRDMMKRCACLVCNQEESGILFGENYEDKSPEEMVEIIKEKIEHAQIPSMVVTLGGQGAVYASRSGESGIVPAIKVDVKDTTGCGDAFFSGVVMGMTYGQDMLSACKIGTKLAASVIITKDNVCPGYMPEEFGLSAK